MEKEIKKCKKENTELLNKINCFESESILDLISKKFMKNKHKLLIEFQEYLKSSDLTDIYAK